MPNPEYFLGAFKRAADGAWRTTAFCDAPPRDLEGAVETAVWERRPLYCVPVPSDGAWAEARWTGQPPEPQTPSAAERGLSKRARQQSEEPSSWQEAAAAATAATATAAAAAQQQQAQAQQQQARDQDAATVDAAAAAAARAKQPKVAPGAAAGDAAPRDQARDQGAAGQQQPQEQQQQQQQEEPRPTCEPGDCIVYVSKKGVEKGG